MRLHPLLKKTLLCFGAGALCALSMPPFGFTPALFAGLSVFYVLLDSTSKHPVLLGWAFGFGYFLIGVSWIGDALLVGGNPWRWAWPLAAMALPAILALYPAFAALVHRRLRPVNRTATFLQFVAVMALAEWLRGTLFTGFPWNLYGYGWGGDSPVSQTAAIWGIYGLSALTIFWAALPGYLWITRAQSNRARRIVAGLAVLSMIGCYGYGLWRLTAYPTLLRDDIRIVLVQPSIPQSEKWTSGRMVRHFEAHLALSRPQPSDRQDPARTTLIVWPETALPWPILDSTEGRDALQATLRQWPGSAYLASGVLLRVDPPDRKAGYRNAVALIDARGGVPWIHDKAHLVPFGEYIPFQDWIPIPTVTGFSGFQAGAGADTLSVGGAFSVSPLICYEIIFPGAGLRSDKPRPDMLLNVTNDGWYGKSAGPYQHFEQARFRAIESGLPVVRSANTGVSAVVDPLGRVVAMKNLLETGSVSVLLPESLPLPAFYEQKGRFLFFILVLCFAATRMVLERSLRAS